MVVYTAKLNRKMFFGITAAVVAIILALVFGLFGRGEAASASKGVVLSSDEEIVRYIKELGYEVEPESMISREITIPKKFDETYEKYNELQKEYGFDLSKYRGKKAMLYTWEIVNHPESQCALLEIMIYKNKPIGGSDIIPLE